MTRIIRVFSDLHLGADNCQSDKILFALKEIDSGVLECNKLIINGDLFDHLDFRKFKKDHWKILHKLRKLSEEMPVIFIVGNHDGGCSETISNLTGLYFSEIHVDGNILFIHGHQFDDFITNNKIITYIADCVYWFLQKIDPSHNLAMFAKRNCKTFLRNAEKIKQKALELAKENGFQTVVCGHTHKQELSKGYLNSGCFTEKNCTYLKLTISSCNGLNDFLEKAEVINL